jgi:glutamate carboxypeptidase
MGGLTTAEQAIVARAGAAPMRAQVEAWAAVNSGTTNLAGCGRMAALLADAFAALPGEPRLVSADPVAAIDHEGRAVEQACGDHLHLVVRPEAPVQLLLTGHMDTVYPADHPFQALHWREPGVLSGPGVADMKSGLAIMLAALTALEASPAAARIGYEVVINADEETGSLSSAGLIAQAARGKAAALTYEPALADGTLAGARGGSGNFALVVRGRSAHAGRNPGDGRNALVAAADLAVRLAGAGVPDLSVNPARINGGSANNVVPDLAILRLNLRPRTTEAAETARRLIDETIAEVAAARDVQIELHGGFTRPPRALDARLAGLVTRAGADLGLTLGWRDTGGVCDGNNIAAAGVPVIDTMGARGGAIHSADEYLLVDSLPERAGLSALTLVRLAGG